MNTFSEIVSKVFERKLSLSEVLVYLTALKDFEIISHKQMMNILNDFINVTERS